jgi:hypothetical protein
MKSRRQAPLRPQADNAYFFRRESIDNQEIVVDHSRNQPPGEQEYLDVESLLSAA